MLPPNMLPTNVPTPLETIRAKLNETHWIEGVKEAVNGLINIVEKQSQELLELRILLDSLSKNQQLPPKKNDQMLRPNEVLKELDRFHKGQQSDSDFQHLRYDWPGHQIEDNENIQRFREEAFFTRASLHQLRSLYYINPRPCQHFTSPVEAGGGYSGHPVGCVNCGHSYNEHIRLAKENLAWSDHDFVAIVFDPIRIVATGGSRVRCKEAAVAAGHLTPLILPGDKVSKTLAEFK